MEHLLYKRKLIKNPQQFILYCNYTQNCIFIAQIDCHLSYNLYTKRMM